MSAPKKNTVVSLRKAKRAVPDDVSTEEAVLQQILDAAQLCDRRGMLVILGFAGGTATTYPRRDAQVIGFPVKPPWRGVR